MYDKVDNLDYALKDIVDQVRGKRRDGDQGRFRARRPEKREDWDHFEQISLVS